MEGEINNLIMVWCQILMSSCYCYGTTKLVAKGTIRFFMFLPVLCLFLHLPVQLNTISFSIPTAFFITWITTFKLLLLVAGNGPLSNPSLPFIHFVIIFSLPINLQKSPKSHPIKEKKPPKKTWNIENYQKDPHHKPISNTYKISLIKSLLHHIKNVLLLTFLVLLIDYKDKFPRNIFSLLICIYVYIGLEVLLGGAAILGRILLGPKIEIEPPFDNPYLSTSLHDFWGRRWNRVSSSCLRSTVFYPTFNYSSRVLGRQWAAFLALMVTFTVSDVMHEIIFSYLGRVRFGWGTPLFFLLHGLLVAIERKLDVKWRLPQIITGPLIFGFAIGTFMWMVLPELLELNVVDRVLAEYEASATFWKDLGLV